MRNNPDAVISGVHRALRPGGRFVAEMGGYRCVEKIRTALLAALNRRNIDGKSADLWYFPTVEDYSARLTRACFTIGHIALIPRPTPATRRRHRLAPNLRPQFHRRQTPAAATATSTSPKSRKLSAPQLCDAQGKWTADYTRLRFKATKAEATKQ